MDLSNPLVVAGLVTVISTVTGSIITIINASRTKVIERKVDNAAQKNDEAQNKLDTIHEKTSETLNNTNGNLRRLQDQLARAEEREAAFKDMMAQLTTVLAAQRNPAVVVPHITRQGRSTDKPSTEKPSTEKPEPPKDPETKG